MCTLVLSLSACKKNKITNQDNYFEKGIREVDEGKYEEAVKSFDKALSYSKLTVGKEEVDIACYKVAAQYLSGDVDAAIKSMDNLIALKKDNPDYYLLRGSYYACKGNFDKADKDYRKVIELEPKDYELYFSIYNNLSSKGQNELAAGYLDSVLSASDDSSISNIAKGRVYLERKDFEKAEKEFKNAIKKDDNEGYLWMAECYNANDKASDALEQIKTYSRKEKPSSKSYNAIAEAQMKLENYDAALDNVKLGLKEKNITNKQDLLKNQIICLEYLGQFKDARAICEKYVKNYPSDQGMLEEWKFLSTR